MAKQLSRPTLNELFADGERPTGDNFESVWMSFLNQKEDGVSISDSDNKNLIVTGGITLGNPKKGAPGTLRYDPGSTKIQYTSDGINFKNISSDSGAFSPVVGSTSAVAYAGGNVGIGTFASAPTHLLEVPLLDNSIAGQQILLGNTVIHNGPPANLGTPGAYIGHANLATNSKGYALFQDRLGQTTINSANGSQLSLAIDGKDIFVIASNGSMGIDGDVSIGSVFGGGHIVAITNRTDKANGIAGVPALTLTGDQSANPARKETLAVNGDVVVTGNLVVTGLVSKTIAGPWAPISDRRVKKDIRPFNEGLQKLLSFDPVVFKFNGKGGTIDNGHEHIGLIAQDVQKIMPELVMSQQIKLNTEDAKESKVLGLDVSPLTFILINAMKELATRVEILEKSK